MDEYLKYLDTDEMKFIMEVQKTLPRKGFTYIREEKKIRHIEKSEKR